MLYLLYCAAGQQRGQLGRLIRLLHMPSMDRRASWLSVEAGVSSSARSKRSPHSHSNRLCPRGADALLARVWLGQLPLSRGSTAEALALLRRVPLPSCSSGNATISET